MNHFFQKMLGTLEHGFNRLRRDRSRLIMPGDVLVRGEYASRVVDQFGNIVGPYRPFKNGSTTVGLNYVLNTGFRGTTQSTSWFAGLINDSGFSALSAADTSASHAGWTEITAYSGNRKAWSPSAASGGSLSVGTALSFTSTPGTILVRGAFLADSNAKGSTTDTIYSTAVEATARSITVGLTYELFYVVTLTPV